jgi:hypothetical protein
MFPNDRTLLVYRLSEDGKYAPPDVFGEGDIVPVTLLGELVIDMGKVSGGKVYGCKQPA